MEWILDNLEYILGMTFFTIVGIIGKLIHRHKNKDKNPCPNTKILQNDLKNLKEQFDDFEGEIKGVISQELEHATEVHKMLFEKINEIGSKIDYTRGQVDQHLKQNNG